MVPIRDIGNLPPEFRKTERNEKQDQLKRTGGQGVRAPDSSSQAQGVSSDQVNVSDSAKLLFQREAEILRFTGEVADAQTLSSEDRQDIEARIETGFYTSNEVTASVAGKISEDDTSDAMDPKNSNITPTRMQQVLENIRMNEYDSQGVVDIIADRILKDL